MTITRDDIARQLEIEDAISEVLFEQYRGTKNMRPWDHQHERVEPLRAILKRMDAAVVEAPERNMTTVPEPFVKTVSND